MSVVEIHYKPEVQPVTDADKIERAADIIEEFGWCQGQLGVGDVRGPHCLIGALMQARVDLGDVPPDAERLNGDPNWDWATEIVPDEPEYVLWRPAERFEKFYMFNDDLPAEDKGKSVVRFLREQARKLRGL